MRKIGFIDYFIDEWHANNYPKWFKDSEANTDFEIAFAWEEAPKGGKPLAQWCAEFGIIPAAGIEELVDECDAICVLAPSNPEVHERLADIPLKSGKPVYIDKPFAPNKATALRLFDKAQVHGTPLMSSSALRFSPALQDAINGKLKGQRVNFTGARGAGSSFWEYSIHQVEMIVSLLGCGAERVMHCGNEKAFHMVIGYADDRSASMTLMGGQGFQISAKADKDTVVLNDMGDFFPGLIDAMLTFFDTGVSPIPAAETIEIASIVSSGIKALEAPGVWLNID